MDCPKWHRLGERCECGHVTVPARFYADDATQKQAEARYMAFLEEHMPELHEKLTSRPITRKYKTGAEVRAKLEKESRSGKSSHGGKRVGAGRPKSKVHP